MRARIQVVGVMACMGLCTSPAPSVNTVAAFADSRREVVRTIPEIKIYGSPDKKSVVQQATVGQRIVVEGVFTHPMGVHGSFATVKMLTPTNVIANSASAKISALGGNKFRFETELKTPARPGSYSVEAWYRQKPVVKQDFEVK
jgi:hypothetical protein